MLVEINLLPRKEPKNIASYMIVGTLAASMLAAGSLGYFQYTGAQQELKTSEQTLTMTQKLLAAEQEKQMASESNTSADKLNEMVAWTETFPVDTVPILKTLSTLLPERGYIITYNLNEEGIIELSVQFDTKRDAAFYLNELIKSPILIDAKLSKMLTNAVIKDRIKEEEKANTPAGSETEGKTAEETEETKTEVTNEKYMPRTLAVYTLTINKDVLRVEQQKEDNK